MGDKSRGNRLAGAAPPTRKYVQGMNTLYGCAYIKIIYVNIITMERGEGERRGGLDRQTDGGRLVGTRLSKIANWHINPGDIFMNVSVSV